MKLVRLLTLSIAFLFAVSDVMAQQVVSGVVTSESDGEPLPGVTVMIQGTAIGTATDLDGQYEIELPDDENVLEYSYIGFVSLEVKVDGRSTIDVEMTTESAEMDELVVTSFGIQREQRALGYAAQDVRGEALVEARESNVMSSLSGRVAGVNISQSGSGIAGSPSIIIRGESSLAGNNRPLFVVDGVPIDNRENTVDAGPQTSRADFGDALSQLNPDDIEDISVLKGPNAAALYGSRAANGVVLITTKSGRGTGGVGVTFNSNVTFEDILRLPDYQNEYGAGSGGEYWFVNGDGTGGGIDGQGYNWGPALDGREIPQIGSQIDEDGNRVPIPFESRPGNVEEFFQTGTNISNNLAVQGGNEDGHFRMSVSHMDRTGIVPNTDLSRTNFSFNAGYNLSENLTVDGVVNYVETSSDNIPNAGYGEESIMYSFIWWGRHLDPNWLRDYWAEGQEGVQQYNFDNNWTNNIWFQVYENTNSMSKNRLFGNISATYGINENLDLMVRAGMDYNDELTQMRKAFSSISDPFGNYREDDNRFSEYNLDALLSYDTQLSEDWRFQGSVGGNYMYQDQRYLMMEAPELTVPGIYNFGNSRVNLNSSHTVQEKSITSAYGVGEFSFRELLYIQLTGRNDWSSTLPSDNYSYFYPSVTVSTVLTDVFNVPQDSPLSYAQIRAGWAQVGNDTDPYRLQNTYSYLQAWGSTQTVSEAATIANEELKPEITSSFETGVDVRFFQGRIGLDVSYYNESTRNQILNVPLAQSSGYTGRFLNAGEIQNEGWEVVLNATPIEQVGGLVWDTQLNWDRNRSEVVELVEGIDSYLMANPYGGTVEARVGGRMGDMYGLILERDPNGNVIHENGIPQLTNDVQRIGNYNPDWQAGLNNRFRFRNYSFEFLLDYSHGGRIYSFTHATGIEGGTIEGTTDARDEDVIGTGVMLDGDGNYVENDVAVPYVTYLRNYYARNNIETNSFDATYLKLREVKIGYSLPPSITDRLALRNATISLVGRNLALWTDVPHIDPETAYMSGAGYLPGFETHQLPSTRSVGFNLNLQF